LVDLVDGGIVGREKDGAAREARFDGVERRLGFPFGAGRPGRESGVGGVGGEAGVREWFRCSGSGREDAGISFWLSAVEALALRANFKDSRSAARRRMARGDIFDGTPFWDQRPDEADLNSKVAMGGERQGRFEKLKNWGSD